MVTGPVIITWLPILSKWGFCISIAVFIGLNNMTSLPTLTPIFSNALYMKYLLLDIRKQLSLFYLSIPCYSLPILLIKYNNPTHLCLTAQTNSFCFPCWITCKYSPETVFTTWLLTISFIAAFISISLLRDIEKFSCLIHALRLTKIDVEVV